MPIEFDDEDKKKKVGRKKLAEKSENIFAPCPRCDRPYHKRENYPDEVCRMCEMEEEDD